MSFEASVEVNYNSSNKTLPDYLFKPELCNVLNVDENGDKISDFNSRLKQPCHLMLSYSTNVTINKIIVTEGSIRSLGKQSRIKETRQFFTSKKVNEPTTFTPDVIASSVSIKKAYGKNGQLKKEDGYKFGMSSYYSPVDLTPFLVDLVVSFNPEIWQYLPPELNLEEDGDSYPIGICFYITVTD